MSTELYLENNAAINPKPSVEILRFKQKHLLNFDRKILAKFITNMAQISPLITSDWKGGRFLLKGDDARIISFLISKGLISFSQSNTNEIVVFVYPWIDIPVSTSKFLENQLVNALTNAF